jgi:hypothetical protein
MVYINIPSINKKESFVSDGSDTFTISDANPKNIDVIVSGIYLTENEDYTIINNKITFIDSPINGENINIKYNT